MDFNNSFTNPLQDNLNSNNNISTKNNYENNKESIEVSYDKASTGDNKKIIQKDQNETNSIIKNNSITNDINFSNISSINNNTSNYNFNSKNIMSLNNNNLSNNEFKENQFISDSNNNLKDYDVNLKLNMTKEELPLQISTIINNSNTLFDNNNDKVINNEKINENKNKNNNNNEEEEELNSIFSEGNEIIKNLTNKIKNYQNLIEKSIKEEFFLNKSQILNNSKVNDSVNYQLVNYLKFRDKFKLTYIRKELFIESNCLCRYCEKNIFGYINVVEILGKKIYYCSKCIKKIIPIIKGPLKITFYKNYNNNEINQDYQSKIKQVKINDKIYENNIISFNYKNVPSSLNLIITIENNGYKKWPSDTIIDINNYCDKNFFTVGCTKICLDIGKSYDIEYELKNINELTPGKYSLVLCCKYSNKKEIFGNIKDMIITIFISIEDEI